MRDQVTVPRLVVGGIQTGAGKTSVAMGLIAALTRRGRIVQSYKVGPDVIDAGYLAHLSRRPCRNLDAWLLGDDGVRRSLAHGSRGADVAIIAGAHGLFDHHGHREGANSGHPFPGSTAEVATLTGAPVVLVLDVSRMAETAAAIALGVRHLDPTLKVAGVILNNVPSERRRRVVEDAIWQRATLPVLGAIPDTPAARMPTLPSTLVPLGENPDADRAIDALATAVERDCDLDLIERVMGTAGAVTVAAPPLSRQPAITRDGTSPVRIAVAFDDAFSCYQADNLELLGAAGAEIVPFSPLTESVPCEVDALYLGGGAGETHVRRLAANHALLSSLRRAHSQRLPIYAEGSGLLLCAEAVELSDGSRHRMAGIVPATVAVDPKHCNAGYRDLRLVRDSLLGRAGDRVRGYEFHTNRVSRTGDCRDGAYVVHDADGDPLGPEGWSTPTLLVSLVQVHFGQRPSVAEHLVEAVRRSRAERRTAVAAGD